MPFWRMLVSSLVMVAPVALYAQSVPYTFTPGSVIRSSELNENFRALAANRGSSGKAVKLAVNGAVVGYFTGGEPPEITGMTDKGFLFCYYRRTGNVKSSPLNFGNTRCGMFTPPQLFFLQANCAGTRYAPLSNEMWLANSIIFSSESRAGLATLIVISSGQALVTLNSPILSVATPGGECQNFQVPLTPGQQGSPTEAYVPTPHDSSVSGFPFGTTHPAISEIKFVLE
jgi:hypothetical protein